MPQIIRVFYREWALFRANQAAYWFALLEPALYLLFFLPGISHLTHGNEHYAAFALPGVLAILAMTVSQHTGAPVFFDRFTGEAETLRTLPISQAAMLSGRLIIEFCEAKSQPLRATNNREGNSPAAIFRDRRGKICGFWS